MTLKLPQEAQVALEEEPQVGDAVLDHRHAVRAHPESEARVLFRVVADLLEDRRVHHSRAEHLEPSGPLAHLAAGVLSAADEAAHVHLDARLGELEVSRSQADPHRPPEYLPVHRRKGTFQVREGEPSVHGEALYLVEHRGVRRVVVAPIDPSGADDVDRRLLGEHRPDLHGRGLGSQDQPFVQNKGVVLASGGMTRRDVQRREVVVVGLYLRPLDDPVAEANEEIHDLVYDPLRRMEVSLWEGHTGEGYVSCLRLEPGLALGCLELPAPRGQGLFYLVRGQVRLPPHLLAIIWW